MKATKKLFWVFNFLVLGLFSAYALGSAIGIGGARTYADTLDKGSFYKQSRNFVVVHGDDNSPSSVSAGGEEICSLTPTQVAELDAFFNVHTTNIPVSNGDTVEVAIVSGHHLTKNELMQFLKASNQSLVCHLVGTNHLFFLPVLPQIS